MSNESTKMLKLAWQERDRTWLAYKHFRKYRKRYEVHAVFGAKNKTPLKRAIKYVYENIPSFDISYFPDMEREFEERSK